MQPFTVHVGRVAPLRRSNVDTDQIIPAEYLKRVTRTGFADGLFSAWRTDPGFVLNLPQHQGATVLVAGPEFGTGSSREHAVWALQDAGFVVVVSQRFADIFRGNAAKAGLLTVELPAAAVERLLQHGERHPDVDVTIDLVAQRVTVADAAAPFDIDPYTRWRLMEGLDDIGLTLDHDDEIAAFERQRPTWLPTTA